MDNYSKLKPSKIFNPVTAAGSQKRDISINVGYWSFDNMHTCTCIQT